MKEFLICCAQLLEGSLCFWWFSGYWRRVQKSFCDYVGLGKIGRVLNPNILPAPTSNKPLSLPTGGIVSPTIRSKTGFANWHAFRVVGCVMRKIFQRLGQGVTLLLVLPLVCQLKKGQ